MARQADQGQRGRVTYGVLSSLSGALVGETVAEFHRTHPQVELLVKGGEHEVVVDWLRDRVIELGFVVWPCPENILTPMEPLLRETALVRQPRQTMFSAASAAFVQSLLRQAKRLDVEILPD